MIGYSATRSFLDPSWVLSKLLLVLLVSQHQQPFQYYSTGVAEAIFNYEVERRVFERVNDFLSGPMVVNSLVERFRKNGAFPHDLDVRDRDAYATMAYSLLNEYQFDMIYYATEDGIFVGFNEAVWGTYREPVDGGYSISDPDMQLYYKACVNRETGSPENCTLSPGSQYAQCINDCALILCEDELSQAPCSSASSTACKKQQKWCPQYEILTATEETAPQLGHVPRTYHCHTTTGVFSQQPGAILQMDGTLGNCLYEDKVTLVNRSLAGAYVYCQGTTCGDVFVGGYRSRDYDHRYRLWYADTKKLQKPNWSPPYPFFTNLDLGITFSTPFYVEDENRRQIFRGVLAVDYAFDHINSFLVDSYGVGSTIDDEEEQDNNNNIQETYVVIYEAAKPNFMVAASTGRSAASKVLESDESVACPDDADDSGKCTVKRVKMEELEGKPFDDVLRASFIQQKELGYPRDLVTAKLSDEAGTKAYVSQSSFYKSDDSLEWIILVISPVERSGTDSVTKSDGLFGVVCVIASLGFSLCFLMFLSFFFKRKSRAIILADWRFTSAFLLGCALLNVSSFTFLGENTEELCLARMWSFHFLFALALSPLFVKVYRMYRLVGTPNRNPAIISNPKAVAMALPIVLIQVIILTIFTIVDPPTPEDKFVVEEALVTQRVECSSNSRALQFVILGFECALVLIGCVLAFVTRNLDSGFGEAKELMFSMYNIAFIGIVIAVISFAMDIDMSGQIVLYSMGIFCGTVFSSAAFVLPRLVQSHQEQQVLPRRSKDGTGSKKPKTSSNSKKKSRVNFSEDVGHEREVGHGSEEISLERAVTGWSACDEEEDATAGIKRASSVNSIPEDDVWTQPGGSENNNSNNHDASGGADNTDPTWTSTDLGTNDPPGSFSHDSPNGASSKEYSQGKDNSQRNRKHYHKEVVSPSVVSCISV